MLDMDPGPDRAQLGFKEAVLSSFGFLNSYGFASVQEETTFVRFESRSVFLNVYHGRASFELGIEIGQLNYPDQKLSLHDIVAWAGAEKIEDFGQHVMFQVSSRSDVQEFIPKLGNLVQKYAVPLLRGETSAFQEANAVSSKRAAQYTKGIGLNQARTRAESAWHAKDYSRVVELYRSIRDDLTSVEIGRLAYAEKQLLETAREGPPRPTCS